MNDTSSIRQPRTGDEVTRTLLLLAGWFFFAIWLGLTGTLNQHGAPPIGLGAAILLPLAVFVADRRLGSPLFGGLVRLELPALIALQTFRIGGVVFVVAWMGGSLPAGFALPAGLGDMAIGLAAPFVAAAVIRRRPHHLALARIWNVLGVADLVIAVTSGVLHGRSPIGLLAGPVTTDVVTRYPLSLIPTFLVPLALMLHLATFRRLASDVLRIHHRSADFTRPKPNRRRSPTYALRVGGAVCPPRRRWRLVERQAEPLSVGSVGPLRQAARRPAPGARPPADRGAAIVDDGPLAAEAAAGGEVGEGLRRQRVRRVRADLR